MKRKILLLLLGGGLCLISIAVFCAHLNPGVGSAQIAHSPLVKAAGHSPAGNSDLYGPYDADLSVTKNDSPDPVTVGRNLAYEITITNGGPHEDNGVTLVDTLPANVVYVWAPASCSGRSIVTCNIGVLEKGARAEVTIIVTPVEAGTIINTVSVSGNGVDPYSGNNTAQQRTVVNPPPSVRFSSSSYSVVENAGPVVITATLSAVSDAVTSVKYATSDGTAVAGTSGDYITATGMLTFAPGRTSQTFNIPIVNDTVFEDIETLTLTLSDPVGMSLGAPYVATLTIEDDDTRPTVQFSRSAYNVDENAGSAIIIATLSTSVALTATVDYTTIDTTAEGGDDYITSSGTLTFSPGETIEGFSVQIIDDDSDEPDETITLKLSNCLNAILGVPNPAVLIIIDDDAEPTVRLSSDAYSIEECAGSASLTATLSNGATYTATTDIRTSDGTATGNSDYVSAHFPLVFPPGRTTMTFAVDIINDLDIEEDETILLTLGTPISATLGSPYSATLTIEDDDRLAGSAFLPVIEKSFCEFTGPYECEPNNPYSNANGPLLSDTNYYGFHDGSGEDRDYYKLYLSEEGQIAIHLTGITDDSFGRDVQLQVFYDSTRIRIGYDVAAPYHIICPSTGSPECTGGMPGWYYILIYTPSGYSISEPYQLQVTYPSTR